MEVPISINLTTVDKVLKYYFQLFIEAEITVKVLISG
jgi:hypothetical protein